jgi:chorismate dehydratase
MIRLSIVSYLNTAPFLYGINHSGLLPDTGFEVSLDNPAQCARKLKAGEAEIGLIPVSVLPTLPEYRLIGETCIGAIGSVKSVLLVSNVPLNRISEIVLDYQSNTSVNLCRILASEYWNISPVFSEAKPGYLGELGGSKAGVVIGDRAFDAALQFNYCYDLSEMWHQYTGLPFVFAVWASIHPVEPTFLKKFEETLDWGIQHIQEAALAAKDHYPSHFEVETYLTKHISYTLDKSKRKGLETFLHLLSKLSELKPA